MVITMGLASTPSKLKDTWESLSSRDTHTFSSLQKLLDVSMNMRYYRQKIQLAKSPTIPFLPVVLKDYTFFNENATYLASQSDLINFAKFNAIGQFVGKTNMLTQETYWFANDLTHFPFFPKAPQEGHHGALDVIADWVEERLNNVQSCYLFCDLLKSSTSVPSS
jgi:hypothetical protein